MMILSSALVVGCFGAKKDDSPERRNGPVTRKWGGWSPHEKLPAKAPKTPPPAKPAYGKRGKFGLDLPKRPPSSSFEQRPSWEALSAAATGAPSTDSGYKYHRVRRRHDTAADDMVRFGAALCYTRGPTNDWDSNAPTTAGGTWKDPKYSKINQNEYIREMHEFGSSFVHNYMRKAGRTSMQRPIDTLLHHNARMSDEQFSECIADVVMPVHNWVRLKLPEIAKNYADAPEIMKHWTDFSTKVQQQTQPVYSHRAGSRKKRIPLKRRDGSRESNDTLFSDRDAKQTAAAEAKPFYILRIDREQRARFGRLAALMYLSRGLCDYFNNDDSPLDRIKLEKRFHKEEPKFKDEANKTSDEKDAHKDWVAEKEAHDSKERKTCWLNPNRKASTFQPADQAKMLEISSLGNRLAHVKSQELGVDLSEYSFWITHLERKIREVQASATAYNFFTKLRKVNVRGTITDPFTACIQLIDKLKNDEEYRLLRPYMVTEFKRDDQVELDSGKGTGKLLQKIKKSDPTAWRVELADKTQIPVLEKNMKNLRKDATRHLDLDSDFKKPHIKNDDVDFSCSAVQWNANNPAWHLGRVPRN